MKISSCGMTFREQQSSYLFPFFVLQHEEGVKFAKECLAEFEEANSIVTQEFSDLWAGRSLNTGLKTQTIAENTQQYIIDTSGRVGKWKDTLWNLFEFGPLHASVTLSIFFPICKFAGFESYIGSVSSHKRLCLMHNGIKFSGTGTSHDPPTIRMDCFTE